MAITLDIDGSVEKIVGNLRTTQTELERTSAGYEKLQTTSREAVSGIRDGVTQATQATNKHTDEVEKQTQSQKKNNDEQRKGNEEQKKQIGILQQLEQELVRLREKQKSATSVEDLKRYNSEIANCEQTIKEYKNEGTTAFKAVDNSASASGETFNKLNDSLVGTVAAFAATYLTALSVQGVMTLSEESIKSYLEAEANVRLLKNALVNIGGEGSKAIKELVDQSQQLSSKSGKSLFGDDEIMQAQRAFAVYGLGSKQIKSVIPVLVEFATQNQLTLEAATDVFIKGVNGQGRALKEYGITLKDSGDRNKNYANTLEAMEAKSKGAFDSLGEGAKKTAQLKDSVGEFKEALGEKLEPVFVKFTSGMIEFVNNVAPKYIDFFFNIPVLLDKYSNALIVMAALLLIYNRNKIASTIIDARDTVVKGFNTAAEYAGIAARFAAGVSVRVYALAVQLMTGQITVATAATRVWNAVTALSGGGLGILVAGLVAAGAAFAIYLNNQRKSNLEQKLSNEIQAEALNNTAKEKSRLEQLLEIARNETLSKQDRLKAIKAINEISPEYLGNLTLETINTDAARLAIEKYLTVLDRKALATAYENRLVALNSDYIKTQGQDLESFITTGDKLLVWTQDGLDALSNERKTKRLNDIDIQITALKRLRDEALKTGAINVDDLTGGLKTSDLNKTTGSEVTDKDGDKKKKLAEQKAKELADLNLAMQKDGLFKELAQEEKAYNEKKAIAVKYGVDYTELTERYNEKVLAIRQKYNNAGVAMDVASMKDGLEKQLALEDIRYEDLMQKYEKLGLDTAAITSQHADNVLKIKMDYIEKEFKLETDKNERQADLDQLAGIERINALKKQADEEINLIEATLKAQQGGSITDEQTKQLLLLRKKTNEAFLKESKEFQTKEATDAENHEILMLELKRDNFKTQKDFEEFKGREILNIRIKYAEAQLALVQKTEGAESNAALEFKKTINDLKGQVADLDSQDGDKSFSIWKMVGLDPENKEDSAIIEGVTTAFNTIKDILTQVNELRLQAAQTALDAANAEVEAAEKTIEAKEKQLDREIELAKLGYANNIEQTQKELAAAKQLEQTKKQEAQKALEEKKKIQKQQLIIDTITQVSSLITAAAQVFQSVASIPFVGVALGAALVAGMIGSFIAAKVMAFKAINNEKAEKGKFGVIKGRRHSDGGENFDDHIEVEDGEAYGVFSRGATNKHRHIIESFVNSVNKDDKDGMYNVAALLAGTGVTMAKEPAELIAKKEQRNEKNKLLLKVDYDDKGVKENNALLKELLKKKKEDENTEYFDGYKIVTKGNHTRIITTKNG